MEISQIYLSLMDLNLYSAEQIALPMSPNLQNSENRNRTSGPVSESAIE